MAIKIVLGIVVTVGFFALFFGAAGRWDWIAGWVFLGVLTLGQSLNAVYVGRRNPETLKRRGSFGEGTKGWDKVCLGLFGLGLGLTMLVAALDAVRFGWAPASAWLWPVGLVMYALSVILVSWAMDANAFFEKTVRIQHDRGHHVVDSGPYRYVRHPGYVATILGMVLATPLLLGSWTAFLPALATAAVLVIRTALEDRTLRRELDGYEDYAKRVPHRLLPGIW